MNNWAWDLVQAMDIWQTMRLPATPNLFFCVIIWCSNCRATATTSGGVLFQASALFWTEDVKFWPILANFGYLLWIFGALLQGWIMRRCPKIDEYQSICSRMCWWTDLSTFDLASQSGVLWLIRCTLREAIQCYFTDSVRRGAGGGRVSLLHGKSLQNSICIWRPTLQRPWPMGYGAVQKSSHFSLYCFSQF